MEKKQYTMPLIEVIALGTERIMTTDSISNIAPNDNFFNQAPKRKTEVFQSRQRLERLFLINNQ